MNLTSEKLKIDFASFKAAQFACQNFHYSKTLPVPPMIRFGVWEYGIFNGVVIFSRGASSNLLKPYGLKQNEGCELTRVALKSHKTEVTRIISICIKMLKKINPGLRLIVSFADLNRGHYGAIYQAGNWIYCGKTNETYSYVDANGRRWHSRQISVSGITTQMGMIRRGPKKSECIKQLELGKFRYLMPLDLEIKKRIEPLRQKNPKRDRSIGIDAPGYHSGEGGVNPTLSLQ